MTGASFGGALLDFRVSSAMVCECCEIRNPAAMDHTWEDFVALLTAKPGDTQGG